MSAAIRCARCSVEVPAVTPDGTCPQCHLETLPAPPRATAETVTRPPDVGDPAATVSHTPDRPAGTPTFGNYELLGELGRGGMGVVYRARQARADRVVALKVIRGGGDEAARQRFLAEGRALARVSHPHIVTVFEVGEEADGPFFTMEFVGGGSLHERVKGGPAFGEAEAATLIEQLAGAVQAAHAVGVLHRDIKPANVLLGAAGTPKLTDFGLAKHLSDQAGLTVTGAALGTPSYMSPEQLAGKKVEGRSDLFSLGVTLYQMLCGSLPFQGESMAQLMFKIANDPHPDIRTVNPALPACVAAVINKALAKDPEQRYLTGEQMAKAIRLCLGTLSPPAKPPAAVS